MKVIYMGLPMLLCSNENCGTLFGRWSFVIEMLPVPTTDECGEPAWGFLAYEGGYLAALWRWLMPPKGEAW